MATVLEFMMAKDKNKKGQKVAVKIKKPKSVAKKNTVLNRINELKRQYINASPKIQSWEKKKVKSPAKPKRKKKQAFGVPEIKTLKGRRQQLDDIMKDMDL